MASLYSLKSGSFLPFVLGLVLAYHVVILVEGGRDMASRLSEEEDLELERQLNMLNKPPIKTMHNRWGDTYDCIEFHKQPAFDHPLLKHRAIPKKEETPSARPHKTLMNEIEGCPKGTVPIRRTTKEDLVRAKHLSSSSNEPHRSFKAGANIRPQGIKILGAAATANVWTPKVKKDQSSGAEIAIIAGPSEIRYGWTADPSMFGDNVTRTFLYWSGDALGYKTYCWNTLCPGFVQYDSTQPPVFYFSHISAVGGSQSEFHTRIEREELSGDWWLSVVLNLTAEDPPRFKIGYWPKELFPSFNPGAEYVYFGGRVTASFDSVAPEMGSGNQPNDHSSDQTGYYSAIKYFDDFAAEIPNSNEVQIQVDCKGPLDSGQFDAIWDDDEDDVFAVVRFGGPGGWTCV
ncbi:hypothetical protein MKW98_006218 [Papaver atlanticum]|uniref:Neprosin PEP catalytic domain-containing protein n=1 Tax=Papaver atlanticum TaxID=357466 RepID=A0AAD4TDW1_9MAGN|nr:hypothetical protein MKW98_006218 [Papaver atlanticum]